MREFIEFIAKHLVDQPDSVNIEEQLEEDRLAFILKVAQNDIGKIIGRKGRTVQAMRVLLSAVAAKEGKRAILRLQE